MSPSSANTSSVTSEEQLIARCRRGDGGAFREIVERHQGYAFSLAFRILWDEDDARETVQESFVRVWKHLAAYDGRKKFTTWLYTIVTHLALDRMKSNMRRTRVITPMSGTTEDVGDTGGTDPVARLENRELAEKIRAIAGDLPPVQRMVFALRDLQDLTVREVAEQLQMSVGAVKANLCHARARIRRSIEQWESSRGTVR